MNVEKIKANLKSLIIRLPSQEKGNTKKIYVDRNKNFVGAGMYGDVFEAIDERDNKFALKVVRFPISTEDQKRLEAIERSYLKEIIASQKFQDPRIYNVYYFGVINWMQEDRLCLLSEFVEGEDLDTFLKRDNLDLNDKINLLKNIAYGIKSIHDRHIIHRDISMNNIRVMSSGEIKIIDFGISFFFFTLTRTLNLTVRDTEHYADRGRVRGNIPYMAPELFKPQKYEGQCGLVIDDNYPEVFKPIYPSDIWAFGIIMYDIFLKRKPFMGDDEALRLAVLCDPIEWPPQTNIPSEIKSLIEKCLAKAPKDRLSIDEILAILSNIELVPELALPAPPEVSSVSSLDLATVPQLKAWFSDRNAWINHTVIEAIYDGEIVNGVPHGKGKCLFRLDNGSSNYNGEWVNGKTHGKGKYNYIAEGQVINYEGNFKDGKYNGHGVMTFDRNNKLGFKSYDGEWANGTANGKGTLIYHDGNKFVGIVKDWERHGEGTLYNNKGEVVKKGEWNNNNHVIQLKQGDS